MASSFMQQIVLCIQNNKNLVLIELITRLQQKDSIISFYKRIKEHHFIHEYNLLENMAFWKGSGVLSNIPLMSDRALSRFQSNLSSSYFPFFIVTEQVSNLYWKYFRKEPSKWKVWTSCIKDVYWAGTVS